MKKHFFIVVAMFCFASFLIAGEKELNQMQKVADDSGGLLTFVRSYIPEMPGVDFDEDQAVILGIPGFNVKPSSFLPAMQMFAEVGHPGFLLHFDGCRNDGLEGMCYANWLHNVRTGILLAKEIALQQKRKLLVFGHSMGGLYAQLALSQMQQEPNGLNGLNVGLVLLAPADGLRSIKNIIGNQWLNGFFPENNLGILEILESMQQGPASMFIQLMCQGLGEKICGVHAAQNNLTLPSLRALIEPSIAFQSRAIPYPSIPAMCIYHEDDFLMDINLYTQNHPEKWLQWNLGKQGNGIQAHTFEYLQQNTQARSELLGSILAWFDLSNFNEQ